MGADKICNQLALVLLRADVRSQVLETAATIRVQSWSVRRAERRSLLDFGAGRFDTGKVAGRETQR